MNKRLSVDDLKAYFMRGCKTPDDLQIGVEWEKIGVYRDSGKAIAYSGKRGVEAIFDGLIKDHGWEPSSYPPVIELKKAGHSITLEPGGQIELSGLKAHRLADNADELYQHLREIREVSDPLGIAWLGIGAQPFSVAQDIEWVPKERYMIMREALKSAGVLTFSMMKETASVQASLDYVSEADAIEKLRLAMGLSPFLVAMLANSPLHNGRPSSFLSRRANIWENTAPERSGILWDRLIPENGFQGYIDYALDIPVLFIQRQAKWVSVRDLNFRRYMESGFLTYHATIDDWQLHLSTIFTEARLKQIVEIRSIDCQKTAMGLAAVALLKGIFYHDKSREEALKILSKFSEAQLGALRGEAARLGLAAVLPNGEKVLGLCREFFDLAYAGLQDEQGYLEPLKDVLINAKTPAESILCCFDENKPILACAAIEG